MFNFSSPLLRKTILAAAMALSMTTMVAAQDAVPASGLGQAWPNAPDLSANANYHVYRFERDGMTYIQVNDLQGKVLGAVATMQGAMFVLPVGVDAQNVTVSTGQPSANLTQRVYQDDGLTIMAAPQGDGNAGIMALAAECGDADPCTLNGIRVR